MEKRRLEELGERLGEAKERGRKRRKRRKGMRGEKAERGIEMMGRRRVKAIREER